MKYEEYTAANGAETDRSLSEIQHDLEDIRNEMSRTLAQIESKFSINELIERMRHAGEGPSQFAKNLGATVRDHPIPVLLIGMGLCALAIGERREAGGRIEGAKSKAEEAGERTRARLSDAGARTSMAIQEAGERAGEMRHRVSEAATRARTTGARVINEQPLALVGLGLAIGALLAASTPMSKEEHERLGPARDELKERSKEFTEEQKAKFESAVE